MGGVNSNKLWLRPKRKGLGDHERKHKVTPKVDASCGMYAMTLFDWGGTKEGGADVDVGGTRGSVMRAPGFRCLVKAKKKGVMADPWGAFHERGGCCM